MTEQPILETRDLECTFQVRQGIFKPKRPLRAVNGISLKVAKGEVLGLVGESGCGKSTLAKMLLGLQAPTAGDVLVDGVPLSQLDRIGVSRRIQPIFQDPYSSLNPRKSIGSIIGLPLRAHGVGGPSDWEREVRKIMDLCGLPQRVYDNFPNQLSGGQRQRVAIARALVMRPEVVICDEPTSALDVSVQSQILNLLLDLRNEFDLTYVLISHNLAVVEHIATRVAVMYLGRIVEETGNRALFGDPKHPYSQALLNSVLTPDPDLDVPETHLGATFPNPIDPPSGCTFHPRCGQKMDACARLAPKPMAAGGGMVECHLFDQSAPTNDAA